VLYPAAGFTKAQVVDYHVRVAAAIVPHLAGRDLTLKRYPNGVEQPFFFEKRCPPHAPDWIRRSPGAIGHVVVDGLASLVWVANLASLELHPSLALADAPSVPTVLAFDLDPGPPAGVLECAAVALELRGLFAVLGLEGFAKTSGSKGMQVYVPLDGASSFDDTRAFALAVAETLERSAPDRVVSRMAKERRAGRVFVDWAQNNAAKTTIAVYSLRAMPRPTVSTPVTWDELEAAVAAGEPDRLRFEADDVLRRIEAHGDLFGPVLTLRQALPSFT
jgi:bifunctional non-homologous end joining protein LigD